MKLRFFATMSIFCAATALVAAQDYDDIYYDSSQEKKTVAEKTPSVEPVKAVADDELVADYYTADQTTGWTGSVVDMRDVDEYNRHYAITAGDTVSIDTAAVADMDGDTFRYTERIRRFHNPEVIDSCADEEAVDLYVYTRPDVNIVVGTPATTYISPLGATVSFGTWGWGLSVYDPWYYDPWYYDPWYYRPYWHYSWYRPYWGWGWCAPYYAYHHHHYYHDWWRPTPPRHYSAGGRRLYANTGRHRGYAAGVTRGGGGRMMAAGNRRPATAGGRISNSTRRQAVTSAVNRRTGNRVALNNSVNRYRTRVNRVNASTGNLAANRVGAVTTGNRINNVTGNRVSAVTGNRVNRTPSVATGTRRAATTVRRTNQLNRRPATTTSTFGTGRTGYRSTSRGTSYYRSPNRSTSTYRSSATTPSYNRSRSTSTYRSSNRTSSYSRGSSYRQSTTRSGGYSRGGGGAVRGGGGGRGRR